MEVFHGVPIEAVKEEFRSFVAPDAPELKRLQAARAAVPMDAPDLVSVLAFLTLDRSQTIRLEAEKSLKELPSGIFSAALASKMHPAVFDCLAKLFHKNMKVLNLIVQNANTDDSTILFIASRAKGALLEAIATNQIRFLRSPKIIEAMYYNPETSMATLNAVIETAVRNNVDLSSIPGYAEIYESIFGSAPERVKTAAGKAEPALRAGKSAPVPAAPVEIAEKGPAGGETFDADAFAREIDQAIATIEGGEQAAGAEEYDGLSAGLEEDAFQEILLSASWSADEFADLEDLEKEGGGRALWIKVNQMSIPQKVRLALLGNDFARSILIRDSRRVVYMSVLKSPKLAEKEVITFSQNKSLNEDIIRTISQNRDWTKNYMVRLSLVTNPKCPPIMVSHFLRTFNNKDLKNLVHDKDIPGYIVRLAKQILDQKEKRESPKK
ncbi:MAG: hypothetical protein FJ088_10415 [Deltaproteobacteria bacterium]|nr:hypothetical protein [Deltaproteobacteria bacterium]